MNLRFFWDTYYFFYFSCFGSVPPLLGAYKKMCTCESVSISKKQRKTKEKPLVRIDLKNIKKKTTIFVLFKI